MFVLCAHLQPINIAQDARLLSTGMFRDPFLMMCSKVTETHLVGSVSFLMMFRAYQYFNVLKSHGDPFGGLILFVLRLIILMFFLLETLLLPHLRRSKFQDQAIR